MDINEVVESLKLSITSGNEVSVPRATVKADELSALLDDHARLQADAERLDWMDGHHFSAYRQCDAIDGLSQHCVVVAEAVYPRRGCVSDGIRGAIDAAKGVQS